MHFRHDDVIFWGIACLIVQVACYSINALERNTRFSWGVKAARERFRTNPILWFFTVVPALLLCTAAVWLCIRAILPDDSALALAVLFGLILTAMVVPFIGYRASSKEVKRLRDIALNHLEAVESKLGELADGPVVEDEELDQKILNIKRTVLEARESLGIKKQDQRDK